MPVLKDGDVVISESLATLEYLDEAYPDPSLVPKGASPQVRQESPIEVKKHILVSLVLGAAQGFGVTRHCFDNAGATLYRDQVKCAQT